MKKIIYMLMCIELVLPLRGKNNTMPNIYIADTTQRLLDDATKRRAAHMKTCPEEPYCSRNGACPRLLDYSCKRAAQNNYLNEIASIAINAGASMSNQAKLDNLIGDTLYWKRKDIIREIIETENIDPDNILVYRIFSPEHPLAESIQFGDIIFVKFLLDHGADKQQILSRLEKYEKYWHLKEKIESNEAMRNLLYSSN